MNQIETTDTRETARFRATAGTTQGFGPTAQEALTALMQSLPADTDLPIVIWPYNRGDAFWSDAQQARLRELKSGVGRLSATEQAELEALVSASFEAAVDRTRFQPLVKS